MRSIVAISVAAVMLWISSPLGGFALGAAEQAQVTGTLAGTATSSQGQTLANFAVRVRDLQTGQIAGSTTSSATGNFSFFGLNPGSYAVEIVNVAGEVVGTSASVAVVAGATVTVTASAAAAALGAAAAAGGAAAVGVAAAAGISTALVVTGVAAAAGIAGIIVAENVGTPSASR